ncbi:MAG: NAD(P)H-hydrate dehydratase [Clostridia bacterium]|nr:NAD(P)H-hydrate dehydratase [Clostridia bacterium]
MVSNFSYAVLTPTDMRRTEEKAFALGVPSILLMEHAAFTVVDELQKALGGDCKGKNVLFLCGTGNNGGDGLAAARLFLRRGGCPTVWLAGEPKTNDAKTNLAWLSLMDDARILNLGEMPKEDWPFDEHHYPRETFDAYVDALLGTGLWGAPEGLMDHLVCVPNAAQENKRVPVIAVDIPSGMDGATGQVYGNAVWADVTVTFHGPKPGLLLTPYGGRVGKTVVADIGLRQMQDDGTLDIDQPELRCRMLRPAALRRLGRRQRDAHKGDCGRVLIYAGNMGMAGAAAMCAKAAVTAGAGLTTIACDKEIIPVLQTLVPNAMCVDIQQAAKNSPAYDVLALGCGLGQSETVWKSILKLWNPDKKSVWDADALNLLAKHPMKLGKHAVITPHPGEAARLLGWGIEKVQADRFITARALAEAYDCIAVLKGSVTVICQMIDGTPSYFLNVVGSPALAKGGSGDALTGILAVCMHRPALTLANAALACLWHGMAGIIGAEQYGERELTTGQLINCLHEAERWGRGERPAPKGWEE